MALADLRKLLADQCIEDAFAAEHGVQYDQAGRALGDAPDHHRVRAGRVRPHRRRHPLGVIRRGRDQFALVRQIQQIEP